MRLSTKVKLLVGVLGILASSSSFAAPARVGAQIGYGFNDAYKFDIGVHGGYTMDEMPIYIGGRFDYFLGSSEDTVLLGTTFSTSSSVWILGIEGGYDFDVADDVMVRPYLGLGFAGVKASATVLNTVVSASTTEFAFWPGVAAYLTVADGFYVGLDMNFRIISGTSAFAMAVPFGMTF